MADSVLGNIGSIFDLASCPAVAVARYSGLWLFVAVRPADEDCAGPRGVQDPGRPTAGEFLDTSPISSPDL